MYSNQNLNWLNLLQQQQNNQPAQGYKGKVPHVHGKGGMEAFRMEPDSSIFLADETEENVVWFKSTDSGGYATGKKAHLVWDDDEQHLNTENYVTKDEFNKLEDKVNKVLEELK